MTSLQVLNCFVVMGKKKNGKLIMPTSKKKWGIILENKTLPVSRIPEELRSKSGPGLS